MKRKVKELFPCIIILSMMLNLLVPVYAANTTKAETQALALKQLGLFKGVSDTDFDLNRAPTRTEAIIMLIRVLGKETEALNGNWSHPFTDVDSWADKYIGYAYENGLTKGISLTKFGTGNANSDMYLAFVLRALGYNDSTGDFAWNEPDRLAKSVGIIPSGTDLTNFLRADVVLVSWSALESNLKDGSKTLAKKLENEAVFTSEDYSSAKQIAGTDKSQSSDDKKDNDKPIENGVDKSQPTDEGLDKSQPIDNDGNSSSSTTATNISVSTFDELRKAMENKEITVINIDADIDITADLEIERNNNPVLNIKQGITLTVNKTFTPVGFIITNDGNIIVNSTINNGLGSFTNNGSITVKNGGTGSSGMTDIYNKGTYIVDAGATLQIERGTQFYNLGTLTSNGSISIKDGGKLSNETGALVNNGTIDLQSYFDGNTQDITGTGILNDNR